jgi:hypothetical protein
MSVRESFVAHFGEEPALRIEEASLMHITEIASIHTKDTWGNDPFQYHFLNAIARECLTRYKDFHGITPDSEEMRLWCVAEGRLHEYEGEFPDYIALMIGVYLHWINWEQAGTEPPEYWGEHDAERERLSAMTTEQMAAHIRALAVDMNKIMDDKRDAENGFA